MFILNMIFEQAARSMNAAATNARELKEFQKMRTVSL